MAVTALTNFRCFRATAQHEIVLAFRNHGLPREALIYDDTPVGLHYVLTHYDIPPPIDFKTYET